MTDDGRNATEARRREVVDKLERWYFGGVTHRDWRDNNPRQKIEIGDWRTILNEAARRIVRLQDAASRVVKEGLADCRGQPVLVPSSELRQELLILQEILKDV